MGIRIYAGIVQVSAFRGKRVGAVFRLRVVLARARVPLKCSAAPMLDVGEHDGDHSSVVIAISFGWTDVADESGASRGRRRRHPRVWLAVKGFPARLRTFCENTARELAISAMSPREEIR